MDEQPGLIKRAFGFNVAVPRRTIEEIKKVAIQEAEDITINPFLNYLDENEKVFTGEVAAEIAKYQGQIYTLGQVMREGQHRSVLNIKV